MSNIVIPALTASSLDTFPAFPGVTLAQQTQAPPVAGETQQPSTTSEGQQPLGPNGGQQAPPSSPFGGGILLIFVGFFMLLILMQVFGGRKQKKQREQMLASLAKHDRVQTIGGVIGAIAEIRDNEIVLKVDENTNTKMRFARSSVQQVLKKAGARSETSSVEEPEMANA